MKKKYLVNVVVAETDEGLTIISNSVPPLEEGDTLAAPHVLGLIACRAMEEYLETLKAQSQLTSDEKPGQSEHGENPPT